MDLAALRERATATYRHRSDQAKDLVDRIPILGRLLNEIIRIEFIDRCMLIAAQGLLALIPMLVVLAAFLPDLTSATRSTPSPRPRGLGQTGESRIESEVDHRPGARPDRADRHRDHALLRDQLRARDPADVRAGLGACRTSAVSRAPAGASCG